MKEFNKNSALAAYWGRQPGKPFLRQDSRKVERYKDVLERVSQSHAANKWPRTCS